MEFNIEIKLSCRRTENIIFFPAHEKFAKKLILTSFGVGLIYHPKSQLKTIVNIYFTVSVTQELQGGLAG
jgi:hypothetical protein